MPDWLEALQADWAWPDLNHVGRILAAVVLGGLIGLEREVRDKPAGFRTIMLICLGACIFSLLSEAVGGADYERTRIAAQIVSGIGFLGAGTIMQSRGSVSGLTTAATLWVVAAIGMAVGAGAYLQAVVGSALVMLALMILGRVEDHLLPRRSAERTIRIVLDPNPELIAGIEQQLIKAGYQVRSLDVEKMPDTLVASFAASGATGDYDRAVQTLFARTGVRQVTLT